MQENTILKIEHVSKFYPGVTALKDVSFTLQKGEVRALVGEDMIIGVSTKNVEQALAAQKAGADYLGVGAMFHTGTKLDAEEVSREAAQEITAAVDIPVVAIGGINKKNILELKGTGVDGVALVSAIFGAENIEEECKTLKALSAEMVQA